MQRRHFLEQTGLFAAASILPVSCLAAVPTKKYKIGLQAFTIRDALEEDVTGTLKIVKSLGYQDLELYGFNPENETYYGLKTEAFKKVLHDSGLTASSCHYGFSDYFEASDSKLHAYVDKCIKGAQELGFRYITWPWLAPEYRTLENFKVLAHKLNLIGEQVIKAGLGFVYHNHGFEFMDHNGNMGYDIIMNETNADLVKLQLDLYWIRHSSKMNPIDLIAKNPERFVMWHIKDMDKITRDYTELGNGSIDYNNMLPQLNQTALEFYFLEQGGNFAKNSIQSITDSARYFKKNLEQYL